MTVTAHSTPKKQMQASILCKTQQQNLYVFDINKKKTLICHPVMAFFLDMEQKNQSPEQWISQNPQKELNLNNYGSYSADAVMYYFQKYQMLKDNGYFAPLDQTKEQSKSLTADMVKASLANLRQVVFETTDACCLACEYCGYGKYYHKYEPRNNRYMDNQIACTTIDFLHHQLNSNLNPSHENIFYVSFYGGEPLMNFPLIRDTVEYVRQLDWKHNRIVFSMTTNALLLEKYIDFLVEHQFNLLISLDGNMENNQYRLKKDGQSAYQDILYNVKHVQETYPDYFQKKVNFNAVLHNKNSVESIFHFFKTTFNKIPAINDLNTFGIRQELQEEFRQMYVNPIESLNKSENYHLIEREMFINLQNIQNLSLFLYRSNDFCFENYNDIMFGHQPKIGFPSGTCHPFGKKMFITVSGKIMGCERIDQDFILGHVDKRQVTLNYEEIANQYNNWFDKIRSQCSVCYNSYQCTQCLFYLDLKQTNPPCGGFMNSQDFSTYVGSVMGYLEKNRDAYSRILTKTVRN